jgi:PPOX class probable F420-dependent enzyme
MLPGDSLRDLAATKTVVLTTYKRDGSGVDTPVSVAVADGRVYFRTWHKAWKTKRLARDPRAKMVPSTLKGRPTGEAVEGRARLLDGAEARRAAKALAVRHRLLQRMLVPWTHRLMGYRTMHYEFLPD